MHEFRNAKDDRIQAQTHRHVWRKNRRRQYHRLPMPPDDTERKGGRCRQPHARLIDLDLRISFRGAGHCAAFAYFARDPIMKTMRWSIHRRREPPTVKIYAMATALHAFNHENIFFKDDFPLFGIFSTQLCICFRGGIIQVNVFFGFFWAFWKPTKVLLIWSYPMRY